MLPILTSLVTGLALLLFLVLTINVSRARGLYKVAAPSIRNRPCAIWKMPRCRSRALHSGFGMSPPYRRALSSAASFLVTFFAMLEGVAQPEQNFSGSLKERLCLRFSDPVDVIAKMINHLAEHLLNVASVNGRIAGFFRFSDHFLSFI